MLSGFAYAVFGWSLATDMGPKVSGHATASDATSLMLFGGLKDGAGSPTTNELWKYDGNVWSLIDAHVGPSPRMYAASAMVGDDFLVFGGWDPLADQSVMFKQDTWKYDTKESNWSRIADMPEPLSRHCACTVGDDMVVIQTHKGTLVYKNGNILAQETIGPAPEGLSMCSIAPLGDHKVVIFGGSSRTQDMSNKVYILDTDTWSWERPPMKGVVPLPRAGACMTGIGRNRFIVNGGAGVAQEGYNHGKGLIPYDDTHTLNVHDDGVYWARWLMPDTPNGRVAASLDIVNSRPMLHGGWNPTSKATFDDTWTFRP